MCLVLHGDILEVAYSIERSVAVKSAILGMLARHADMVDECMDCLVGTIVLVDLVLLGTAVGEGDDGFTMADGNRGNGVDADERMGVVGIMIVRTLHQGTLWVDVS